MQLSDAQKRVLVLAIQVVGDEDQIRLAAGRFGHAGRVLHVGRHEEVIADGRSAAAAISGLLAEGLIRLESPRERRYALTGKGRRIAERLKKEAR